MKTKTVSLCALFLALLAKSPLDAAPQKVAAAKSVASTRDAKRAPLSALERGFLSPPDATKPAVYWYWKNDNISKTGLTKDLEAMKRVGIGTAYIGSIGLAGAFPEGRVQMRSPQWWDAVAHAMRESTRLGLTLGMFNSPGWSQSGGPWVKPTQAMRFLARRETRVRGPQRFTGKIEVPAEWQDVALLAFPAPQNDDDTLAKHNPKITFGGADSAGLSALIDGDASTSFPLASTRDAQTLSIETAQPITARTFSLAFVPGNYQVTAELQAEDARGVFQTLRTMTLNRQHVGPGVGFDVAAPVVLSLSQSVTAKRFRVLFRDVTGSAAISALDISGAARLERANEKQLGHTFSAGVQPPFEAYVWPQPAPVKEELVVRPENVREISARMAQDGTIAWDVPPGDWIIQRMGMTPTGARNGPSLPQDSGYEVDKMNRAHVREHFKGYIAEALRRVPARERRSFRTVIADSYEVGPQNWTDTTRADFRKTYGYDAAPFLPVLSGRIVESADASERFLWDLRRLVAERIASEYVGGLREVANQNGLNLWLENYGHFGFPSEFLLYGAYTDGLGGEFWESGELGNVELPAAVSAGHIYAKSVISAEAFTGGPQFVSHPWSLKKRGDWAFARGINHFVLHLYTHQPYDNAKPGINAPWGTEFNRHNTWFNDSRSWIDYLRRSSFLLQAGKSVSDVAYFIGEDAPKMSGPRSPALPAGRAADDINSDAILNRLKVVKNRFVLPDGVSYRVLVLPPQDTMRPRVLAKLSQLVREGGTILGDPPRRSPSLQNAPRADLQVRKLASVLWGNLDGKTRTSRPFGKGRVFRGVSLERVFNEMKIAPDVENLPGSAMYLHRATSEGDVYFLSNQSENAVSLRPIFRSAQNRPELWDADSARRVAARRYVVRNGRTQIEMNLPPRGAVFVVFRKGGGAPSASRVLANGKTVWRAAAFASSVNDAAIPRDDGVNAINTFSYATWAKPTSQITLPQEESVGANGLAHTRNDVVYPPPAHILIGAGHAASGLSVGTNGVVLYEHSANYFSAVLVYAAKLSRATHFAVAYKNGVPTLFINGKLAKIGRKSAYKVHSPVARDLAGATRSETTMANRALNATEIARWMNATRPAADLPFDLENNEFPAGKWQVIFADGSASTRTIAKAPAPISLDANWRVRFDPKLGGPGNVNFARLQSWTERSESGIKYYSGSAIYTKTFQLAGFQIANRRWTIDLGNVANIAQAKLNGSDLGTQWKPPFRFDVTRALRSGTNTLQVRVVNTWINRLIGDENFPDFGARRGGGHLAQWPDWVLEGKSNPTQRVGIASYQQWSKETPLQPAGLLGPVTLQAMNASGGF